MNRWVRVGALALACALLPGHAAGAASSPDLLDQHQAAKQPDRIELPDGWQPEGIAARGKYVFVGSLVDGAIWRANTKNGKGRVFVKGKAGRVAVGLHFDRRRQVLWVAGGETSELRAYDVDSGNLLRTYEFPSAGDRFINDVAVIHTTVYATDSLQQELGVVRVHGGLPPESAATTLPLKGDLEYGDGFNLNGIVRTQRRLLAVQSNTGLLFQIDRHSGRTTQVDLGGELLTNGDGLESNGGGIVYAVRNADNLIAVVEIAEGATSGEVKATIEDDDLDVPSTVAITQDSLWAVNARFSTPPEPDTPYWVTRLEKYEG